MGGNEIMTKTPMNAPLSGPPTRTRREVRTDVQALRALAVAAVLGFHFAPGLLPGGYVGVDVFFVISGFVITTLMITEIRNTGRLSFSKFYARRARRILPAATVTIILTVLAGMLLWPLNLWESLGKDEIGRAHVCTPVPWPSRMPSSSWKNNT